MKQTSLPLDLIVKKTRKQIFLEQMEKVVPWAALVERIAPYYPEGKTGRPLFSLQTMLRVHFMQQWFTLSDPAMEEAFFDTPLYREFAQLEEFGRLPDESTILRFRHRLERHKLAEEILATVNELLTSKGLLLKVGTVVDATLIEAPSSTKNKDHKRDPDMHSSKKGEQMYFGMKAHIGADADSGLVHTVRGTSGNVSDVLEGNSLLHDEGTLPGFEEEHGPTRHTVCAVQFVDGAWRVDGSAGMSAPKTWAKALQSARTAPSGSENNANWGNCS